MHNLIVGNTSQLSYYFPKEYKRISSRNIDFDKLKTMKFDRVFLTFSECRTYIEDNSIDFENVNYYYTLELINFFEPLCNSIIVYSSSELWNNSNGKINLETPFDYNPSPYVESVAKITNHIIEARKQGLHSKVILLYPFNFNSPYRKSGFLFAKVFESIIHEKKIKIGNTYFYRDLVHPRYVAQKSMDAQKDEIIGSGRLIHINDFIRDLYIHYDMSYSRLVEEDNSLSLKLKRNTFYLDSNTHLYKNLFWDTVCDIDRMKDKQQDDKPIY